MHIDVHITRYLLHKTYLTVSTDVLASTTAHSGMECYYMVHESAHFEVLYKGIHYARI